MPRLQDLPYVAMDQISLCSSLNSTISDQPGLGRTTGKLISTGGRQLERLLSRAAERLGLGPNALVLRALRALRGTQQARDCAVCGGGRFFAQVSAGRRLDPDAVLRIMIESAETGCHICRGRFAQDILEKRTFRKQCARLVRYLDSDNTRIALRYVTAFALFHEDLSHFFVHLGATEAIENLLRPSFALRSEAHDALLSASRTALLCMEEIRVVTVAHDIRQLVRANGELVNVEVENDEEGNPMRFMRLARSMDPQGMLHFIRGSREHRQAVRRVLDRLALNFRALGSFTRDHDLRPLALHQLSALMAHATLVVSSKRQRNPYTAMLSCSRLTVDVLTATMRARSIPMHRVHDWPTLCLTEDPIENSVFKALVQQLHPQILSSMRDGRLSRMAHDMILLACQPVSKPVSKSEYALGQHCSEKSWLLMCTLWRDMKNRLPLLD